ncbi:hypothetical protein GQ54DRAFT_2803 [Martensiomyces pterosporus]|nr:hypothetical protein GQ54DRAFT_2803 [Martensiomyces pterosporus]
MDPVQGVLAVGYASGHISLYLPKYPTSSQVCALAKSPIIHLRFIPDQAALAAIDDQGTLWVFDTNTLELCFSYKIPSMPTAVSLIAGSNWLVLGTEIGRVYFVDVVGGRKSDYSIGCQIHPPSHVAAVEPHPVETEKILIAYSEGTCVVCDIGKASVSEKAMVVARYKFEHPAGLKQSLHRAPVSLDFNSSSGGSDKLQPPPPPPQPTAQQTQHPASRRSIDGVHTIEPQLTGAGWSPNGELIASVYDNGILCIFNTGTGPQPAIARTITHPDVLSTGSAAVAGADLERNMRCLGHVRWCTHEHLDQSFLVVTSGSTVTYQQIIHVFGTGNRTASIKSSADIATHDRYELGSSMTSLCTVPWSSPWRNGNEGLRGLVVLLGQPSAVRGLRLDAGLHLAWSTNLPGELSWCSTPAVIARETRGTLSLSLLDSLPTTIGGHLLDTVSAPDPGFTPDREPGVAGLLCCVDSLDTVSLWCSYAQKLRQCTGARMNCQYVSRMLGIEGKISAVDLYGSSGLLVLGMSSGETLVCVVTEDPEMSLAQQCTPIPEVRELASIYYLDAEVMGEQALEDEEEAQVVKSPTEGLHVDANVPANKPESKSSSAASSRRSSLRLCRLRSAQTDSVARRMSRHFRNRSESMHEAEKSSSHRLSKQSTMSVSALLRRGSLLVGRNGDSSEKSGTRSPESAQELLIAGVQRMMAEEERGHASRPLDIDSGVWASRTAKVNEEMTKMIYGLKFTASQRKCIDDAGLSDRTRKQGSGSESPGAGASERPTSCVIPFMLARFYCRKVVRVVAGYDGIAAIVYDGGVFAVIDCVKQAVLMADNLNQPPDATQTAKDIFTAARTAQSPGAEQGPAAKSQAAAGSKEVETITAASIVRFHGGGSSNGKVAGVGPGAENGDHFIVGTSRGYITLYSIYSTSPPRTQAWACAGPILYLEMENVTHTSTRESSTVIPHLLVVGSHAAVTVHSGVTPTPVFSHAAPKSARFLGMHVVKLRTGWQGVAAIDSQANVTLLSLPELREEAVVPIPGAKDLISSASIEINTHGHISLLGPNALLLQASIAEQVGGAEPPESRDSGKRSFFDAALRSPPRPARKGITSWLFGKAHSSAQDADAFLSSHFRDLLVGGGTQPGARLRQIEDRGRAGKDASGNSPGAGHEPSRAAEMGRSVDMSPFSEARNLLDKREQRLNDLDQKTQRMSQQASSFLTEIRAYNSKQETKRKKRFGLF